jgi:hypothetical protein
MSKVGIGVGRHRTGLTNRMSRASTHQQVERMSMRITKLSGIVAALLSIAPIGISAQSASPKTKARSAAVRSCKITSALAHST